MHYVSRTSQLQKSAKSLVSFSRSITPARGWSDEVFDGIEIGPGFKPQKWAEEATVHAGTRFSSYVVTTPFLGRQTTMMRDEQRLLSHVTHIECGEVVHSILEGGEVQERHRYGENVRRCCLALDDFTGRAILFWTDEQGQAWLNGVRVETPEGDNDFPFVAVSQISHTPDVEKPHPYGMLGVKSRATGDIWVTRFDIKSLKPETFSKLDVGPCLGGVDFAAWKNTVALRVDVLIDGQPVVHVAQSKSGLRKIGAFKAIEVEDKGITGASPSMGAMVVDRMGRFQVPIVVTRGETSEFILATLGEDAVSIGHIQNAMTLPPVSVARFPKKDETDAVASVARDAASGNGVSDGLGLIATYIDGGRLMASNSQAGGTHFPEDGMLNHEMPKVLLFKSSQCYTRPGAAANMVSMDYLYLEADQTGAPVPGGPFFDTWDMPLPEPVLAAKVKGKAVHLKIARDGWFIQGQTMFDIDNPLIKIVAVELIDGRTAVVKCDRPVPPGTSVRFVAQSRYYHHAAATTVR